MNRLTIIALLLMAAIGTRGNTESDTLGVYYRYAEEDKTAPQYLNNVGYHLEAQYSYADGKTPLWLNANRYGLSSLKNNNGYLRAAVERDIATDNERRWGLGYGLDLAVAQGYTSKLIVQQAYVEGRWLKGVLTIGSKQQPMEMKNGYLSSGAQCLGINARPVPQVRLGLGDYWTIPGMKGMLHFKGHISYGMMTDDKWQQDFTAKAQRYTENALYHQKAGYLLIGDRNDYYPLSLELGLEMASIFGGTAHYLDANGTMQADKQKFSLRQLWNAFLPGGSKGDVTDGDNYSNEQGDVLGSWVIKLNYNTDDWCFSLYGDKFFEDHSAMLFMDNNSYGVGEDWMKRKNNKFVVYDLKDMMLGAELKLKWDAWVNNVVFEYIYTKYQSGPIYHDHTYTIADHIGGRDNFYNHNLQTGWQHWGQVIGNPLYRSPMYNDDGKIEVQNNRFYAFHLGIAGQPMHNLKYRLMGTWQKGFGTYAVPYIDPKYNTSIMGEMEYSFIERNDFLRGLKIKVAAGADFGKILGNNYGGQITISYDGLLTR